MNFKTFTSNQTDLDKLRDLAETILKIADDSLIDDWNKQNPKDYMRG